jgi:serine/threonine protein kinase
MQAANVLINMDGRVVLSDFGVTANLLEPPKTVQYTRRPTLTLRDICSAADLEQLAIDEQGEFTADVLASSPESWGCTPTSTESVASFQDPGSYGSSGSCQGGGGGCQSAWACQKYLARNTFTGTPCFMAPEVMAATNDPQSAGCADDPNLCHSFPAGLETI